MNTAFAEANIINKGISYQWKTNTTTTGKSTLSYESVTSETTPLSEKPKYGYMMVLYEISTDSLPPNIGSTLMIEGSSEQVGLMEDAIASSRILSHRLPVVAQTEELLNWDIAIERSPKRPSGTLLVTLKYAGCGTPMPDDNPWDD